MAGTFWLGLILLQYILTLFFLGTKRNTAFLAVYLYSIFSYDFVFINASYHLPERVLTFTKPYQEYLFAYFLIRYLAVLYRDKVINGIDRGILYLLVLPSLITLIADIAINRHPVQSFMGMRLYLLPVLLSYCLYRAGFLEKIRLKHVIGIVLTLSILSGIYGHFQRLHFDGNVQSLWFHRFFNRYSTNPVDYGWANYLRNNRLRLTSIYVSPITMSLMMAIPVLFAGTELLQRGRRLDWSRRGVLLAIFAFCLCYQWLTQTRIGLITDVIGACTILLFRVRRDTFFRTLLIPVGLVALTFVTLFMNFGDDSALGRLDQYRLFFELYTLKGLGFSDPLVQTNFDAFFMSVALLYGCLAFFPLSLIGIANYQLYKAAKSIPDSAFLVAVYGFSLALLYGFTFQYIAGSATYKIYLLFIFIALSYVKPGKHRFVEAHPDRAIPG